MKRKTNKNVKMMKHAKMNQDISVAAGSYDSNNNKTTTQSANLNDATAGDMTIFL